MTRHRARSMAMMMMALMFGVANRAGAQAGEAKTAPAVDTGALAKTTQNPVGDVAALPLQFNFYGGGGLGDQTLLITNFQPAVPIKITPKWTLLARTIVPFISSPAGGADRVGGIGDIQEQVFFTPATPGALIWGIGPVVSIPTATNASSRRAAGPPVRPRSWSR